MARWQTKKRALHTAYTANAFLCSRWGPVRQFQHFDGRIFVIVVFVAWLCFVDDVHTLCSFRRSLCYSSRFTVVNFPLILTNNLLFKSKLSRFPSHSIRIRKCVCVCTYLDYNDWRCILYRHSMCVVCIFRVAVAMTAFVCCMCVCLCAFIWSECVVFCSFFRSFSLACYSLIFFQTKDSLIQFEKKENKTTEEWPYAFDSEEYNNKKM